MRPAVTTQAGAVDLNVAGALTGAGEPVGQDVTIAQATLEAAGFRTRVVLEDTDEASFDGIVISQDPIGGTQGKPNSVVTLFVGRFTDNSGEETTTTP